MGEVVVAWSARYPLLVPVPAEILALAAGMAFGPVWGFVTVWVEAMLGAYLGFFLARTFGQPCRRLLGMPQSITGKGLANSCSGGASIMSRTCCIMCMKNRRGVSVSRGDRRARPRRARPVRYRARCPFPAFRGKPRRCRRCQPMT